MAGRHATGLEEHLGAPAAVEHELHRELGELGHTAGGQTPPEHGVVEEIAHHQQQMAGITGNRWGHRSRLVM